MRAIAGATGFVGRRLVRRLLLRGENVRCLVRDPARARRVLGSGPELAPADLERHEDALEAALEGVEHVDFLVHLMGGNGSAYAERERAMGERFGRAAQRAGVGSLSYLGGLGGHSPHLASREATAAALAEHGPPTLHFRAGMIVGPGSESYELLRAIVDRLAVVPSAPWLNNLTQPIGIRDTVSYLVQAPATSAAHGRDVEIGGPEVLSYREVIERLAAEMGRRRPRFVPVPEGIATGPVIAAGAATVTRGDRSLAGELALGLSRDTIVRDPSGQAAFDIRPEPLGVVFQRCLEEEELEKEDTGV